MALVERRQRNLLVMASAVLLLALSLSFQCDAFTSPSRLRPVKVPSRPMARDERLAVTSAGLVRGDQASRQPSHTSLHAKPSVSRGLLSAEGALASILSPMAKSMEVTPRAVATSAAAAATIGALSLSLAAFGVMSNPPAYANCSVGTASHYLDSWALDGILESIGGEQGHFGYYSTPSSRRPWGWRGLDKARCDTIDKACEFAGIKTSVALGRGKNAKPKRMSVLDVGCGVGGSSRYLAEKLSGPSNHVSVLGISISPEEVSRARAISELRNISAQTVRFECMDASGSATSSTTNSSSNSKPVDSDANVNGQGDAQIPSSSKSLARASFDLIWAAESAEYMPDKSKFINEMFRLLKPGGRLIVLAKCRGAPLKTSASKTSLLDDEESVDPSIQAVERHWAMPTLVSKERYLSILRHANLVAPRSIRGADWTNHTIVPTYRNLATSVLLQPWHVLLRPWRWLSYLRSAVAAVRAGRAASQGSLEYVVLTAARRMSAERSPAVQGTNAALSLSAKKAPVAKGANVSAVKAAPKSMKA